MLAVDVVKVLELSLPLLLHQLQRLLSHPHKPVRRWTTLLELTLHSNLLHILLSLLLQLTQLSHQPPILPSLQPPILHSLQPPILHSHKMLVILHLLDPMAAFLFNPFLLLLPLTNQNLLLMVEQLIHQLCLNHNQL